MVRSGYRVKSLSTPPRLPCPRLAVRSSLSLPLQIKEDKGFHVYTLHVKTDNTFDLYIDTEVAGSGSLLEDVEPPVAQPKEIDDPDDEQPEDWVTEVRVSLLSHNPFIISVFCVYACVCVCVICFCVILLLCYFVVFFYFIANEQEHGYCRWLLRFVFE